MRTSVLSRRWRGLLLSGRVLRGVAFHKLEAALGRVSPAVSLLEIHVAKWACRLPPEQLRASRVTSLLRAAARLAPEEFVLALRDESTRNTDDVELPSFHRVTSIVLDALFFFKVPASVEFPVLETMSLSGCMVDLKALLPQCPRLRVLRIKLTKFWTKGIDLTVHSALLQELVVENKWMRNVDIVAPLLKQMTMSMTSLLDKNISVMAPMMQNVSWQCRYARVLGKTGFGPWCLAKLRLETAERQEQPTSLHIHAYTNNKSYILPVDEDNCKQEIQKHMIAAFSVLKLHLETVGHVFGPFVFHLLGMNRIGSDIHMLRVVLRRSKEKKSCMANCRCDPPNWTTKTISLTALEEMEIDGFEGDDHEFHFLKLVFKSAPILERVTVKLSHEGSSSSDICAKLHDIFRAYSSVECCVYLSSGLTHGRANCFSA
ncbi:hypothetical protein CFC21_105583 [Triticum aestivum]|uniref:F-box/LRR-repeat protein 15/At3g58940/PEG3-like LRR domain-containing protein n=2 Tax=Triticum aestivum TaxID=4565 RepID=A0A3B6SKL2_WHEAT|nr:uncharacterized protein LOC123161669 [Triticum aestivum]KAF7104708.1 hypothetical protein CFC21_105583 [Triticum aestivum]